MPTKDPDARLDYAFDWSAWLGDTETITSHSIIKEPSDSAVVVDSSSEAAGRVVAWLSGGEVGKSVHITCRITTNEGRTDDRTRRIDIANR